MSADRRFALAPMDVLILGITLMLWVLPISFIGGSLLSGRSVLLGPGVFVLAIYAWIWLRFRPTEFVLTPTDVQIVWPLKRAEFSRASITGVRIMDRKALKAEVGWGGRVGAGGLWGAFGWLWTSKRGIVQMYVSRIDTFVWIDRGTERPWLITPENPEEFVRLASPVRPA